MNELFNFNDTWIVVEQNWWLVLLSLALGVWVGWVTCSRENNRPKANKGKNDVSLSFGTCPLDAPCFFHRLHLWLPRALDV